MGTKREWPDHLNMAGNRSLRHLYRSTGFPGSVGTCRLIGINSIVVQAGDTLGKILLRTYKRLDRRLLTLVQGANPHLTNPAHIEIGQRLVLPNLSQ